MRKRVATLVFGCVTLAIPARDARVFAQETSVNTAIIRALVRDIAVPWRDGMKKTPPPVIGVTTESLHRCPPPPEAFRGCVSQDVIDQARTEAARGTWSFDLVSDMQKLTTDAITFDHLDLSGFDPIVAQTREERDRGGTLPLTLSRPAVRGKNALVVVQFARTWVYLVLLTEKDTGWVVTTKVVNGVS